MCIQCICKAMILYRLYQNIPFPRKKENIKGQRSYKQVDSQVSCHVSRLLPIMSNDVQFVIAPVMTLLMNPDKVFPLIIMRAV